MQAMKTRDEAQRQIENAFRQEEEQANKACDAAVARALKTRQDNIEKAQRVRDETIEQAWQIYSKITAK